MKLHATFRVERVQALTKYTKTDHPDGTWTAEPSSMVEVYAVADGVNQTPLLETQEQIKWLTGQHFAPRVGELVSVRIETTREA